MKKFILSTLAIMVFYWTNAQEEGFVKKDFFISGSVSYNTTSQGDLDSNIFEFSPRLGYFVSENISLGVQLSYISTKADIVDPFSTFVLELDTNTFAVGAFGRYYFTPATRFSFFGELGVVYLTSNSELEGVDQGDIDGFGLGISPGISYFLSNRLALEAAWGALQYTTTNPEEGRSSNSFGIGLNLQDISLGIVYKF